MWLADYNKQSKMPYASKLPLNFRSQVFNNTGVNSICNDAEECDCITCVF